MKFIWDIIWDKLKDQVEDLWFHDSSCYIMVVISKCHFEEGLYQILYQQLLVSRILLTWEIFTIRAWKQLVL